MNYIDTKVLQSRINPYRFFLETWDVNLNKDEAIKHAMEAVEDFPDEVIDELLNAGISGWYSAPEYAPLEVASDPVEASLAAVGYSWFPGGTQQGDSAVYVIGTEDSECISKSMTATSPTPAVIIRRCFVGRTTRRISEVRHTYRLSRRAVLEGWTIYCAGRRSTTNTRKRLGSTIGCRR